MAEQGPKFGGPPVKNWGPKTWKISVDFFATSDFDSEYLRNGLRYPNRKKKFSSPIRPAFYETDPVNFGPLISEI